jgi:hypothetical protein
MGEAGFVTLARRIDLAEVRLGDGTCSRMRPTERGSTAPIVPVEAGQLAGSKLRSASWRSEPLRSGTPVTRSLTASRSVQVDTWPSISEGVALATHQRGRRSIRAIYRRGLHDEPSLR